jgi:hypothetical protein
MRFLLFHTSRKFFSENIVTCIPIARQRFDKHIPLPANSLNNRTSIVRQRTSKHTYLTREALFSVRSVPRDYKRIYSEDATEYRRVVVVESEMKGRASRSQPAGM